jgi:TolB-like protein
VIFADGTVTGPGVVLAQRVEQLAEPNGVSLTAAIHEAVPRRMPFAYDDLGRRELKGFEEAVQVYTATLSSNQRVPPPESIDKKRFRPKTRWIAGAAIAIVLATTVGALLWLQPWKPDVEPASAARMAFPLPDRPSIAVLPFVSLSSEAEPGFLAEGITEDIITNLARLPALFVVDRHSTFTYKDKAVKVQQVAEELGVRYVVEGSVRRAGNRVRITAQLIDALSGAHMWAQRYNREIKDVFALQEEIAKTIAVKLVGELSWAEGNRRSTPQHLEAFHLTLRAIKEFLRLNRTGIESSRKLAQRAVELDPTYAKAWAALSIAHLYDARFRWSTTPGESLALAIEFAEKAVGLDDTEYYAHRALALTYEQRGEFDRAIAANDRAIILNPNSADLLAFSSLSLFFSGRFDEAIGRVREAMRLNPYSPWYYSHLLGLGLYHTRQYEAAAVAYEKAIQANPESYPTTYQLAATYGQLGRKAEAAALAQEVLRIKPQYRISTFKRPFRPHDLEHLKDGLRKAGLPE